MSTETSHLRAVPTSREGLRAGEPIAAPAGERGAAPVDATAGPAGAVGAAGRRGARAGWRSGVGRGFGLGSRLGPTARGAAAMALVGGSAAVSRVLVDAPLFTAQALRYLAAATLIVVVARLRKVRIVRPRGREWLWLLAVAGAGLVLFNVALVRGAAHAEPAVLAVAIACVPVLLGVVGPLLERRPLRARVVVAAVVVTAGAVLVEGAGRADGIGVLWALVALACEAGFTLLAVPVLGRHGAWGVSLHAVWIGAVLFTALAVPLEGWDAVTRLDAGDLLAVAYLAVLVTAAAFVLWYGAVGVLGADRAGLLTGVAPVSAAVAGTAGGLGAPHPGVWLGIVVVSAGLAVGLRAGRV